MCHDSHTNAAEVASACIVCYENIRGDHQSASSLSRGQSDETSRNATSFEKPDITAICVTLLSSLVNTTPINIPREEIHSKTCEFKDK